MRKVLQENYIIFKKRIILELENSMANFLENKSLLLLPIVPTKVIEPIAKSEEILKPEEESKNQLKPKEKQKNKPENKRTVFPKLEAKLNQPMPNMPIIPISTSL